jgi:hypothetical protein
LLTRNFQSADSVSGLAAAIRRAEGEPDSAIEGLKPVYSSRRCRFIGYASATAISPWCDGW